jgi:hypothetical protein
VQKARGIRLVNDEISEPLVGVGLAVAPRKMLASIPRHTMLFVSRVASFSVPAWYNPRTVAVRIELGEQRAAAHAQHAQRLVDPAACV